MGKTEQIGLRFAILQQVFTSQVGFITLHRQNRYPDEADLIVVAAIAAVAVAADVTVVVGAAVVAAAAEGSCMLAFAQVVISALTLPHSLQSG